jgi:hypothetical protein
MFVTLIQSRVTSGADFLRRFRPCAVNYIVQFRRGITSGSYFITPASGYANQRSTHPPSNTSPPYGISQEELAVQEIFDYGIWYIGTEIDCEQKLDRDLALLVCSGFNTVRIVGIGPIMDINTQTLTYPITPKSSASLTEYLNLLTKLLSKVAAHGLKAILLIGSDGPNKAQWQQPDLYRQFLIDVCTHIGDHPGLLAYDLYNEPAWGYPGLTSMNKLLTAHWIADSYWTIKSVLPNQLVTIGLTHPDAIGTWDPALIPVDFVSYHFYVDTIEKMASLFYWTQQTSVRPWIIGETGLAGSDHPDDPKVTVPIASEAEQKNFVDATLQQSLDYGGNGYSWWQYQEVRWGEPSSFMGLMTRLDPQNLAASEQKKTAFFSFASYAGLVRNPQNAIRPNIYDNLESYPTTILQGQVFDEDGNPLADASVVARSSTNVPYVTLSAPDGRFAVKAPGLISVASAQASKPGYASVDPRPNLNNVVLERWRDDTWSRRWIASLPGKLNAGSFNWQISPTDAFYVGDFDGDGADELLCAQASGSPSDAMVMLRFDGNWTLEWQNGNNTGIYPYRQRMLVGDFDGDGADEVLAIGTPGDWLTLFKYHNAGWQWLSSTGGNHQHALVPYGNNLRVGNFNGSGGDLLLGIASWTTLFRFDVGKNDWEWVDSDYGLSNDPTHPLSVIRPYASQLMIGDLDGNGRDEILGIAGNKPNQWVTLFGDRGKGFPEWMISNYGSETAVMADLASFQSKAVIGHFDGLAHDRILGLVGRPAIFGIGDDDFQRIWGSARMQLAGLNIAAGDRILTFNTLPRMPSYLLIIPDPSRKAALIAFDPVLGS